MKPKRTIEKYLGGGNQVVNIASRVPKKIKENQKPQHNTKLGSCRKTDVENAVKRGFRKHCVQVADATATGSPFLDFLEVDFFREGTALFFFIEVFFDETLAEGAFFFMTLAGARGMTDEDDDVEVFDLAVGFLGDESVLTFDGFVAAFPFAPSL